MLEYSNKVFVTYETNGGGCLTNRCVSMCVPRRELLRPSSHLQCRGFKLKLKSAVLVYFRNPPPPPTSARFLGTTSRLLVFQAFGSASVGEVQYQGDFSSLAVVPVLPERPVHILIEPVSV